MVSINKDVSSKLQCSSLTYKKDLDIFNVSHCSADYDVVECERGWVSADGFVFLLGKEQQTAASSVTSSRHVHCNQQTVIVIY